MDAKTLCLGALMHEDASGYEIRKLFEDGLFSAIHDVSFGSIYPALTVLLERDWVTCRVAEQNGRPDKKIYSITPTGREAFLDAISAPPAPDKMRSEMLFILSFGDYLPRADVIALVDRYIESYAAKLEALQSCTCIEEAPPVRKFVNDFGLAMYETAISFLRRHRDDLVLQASGEANSNDGPARGSNPAPVAAAGGPS
jgi:PadR family transcriptional regulator AphA